MKETIFETSHEMHSVFLLSFIPGHSIIIKIYLIYFALIISVKAHSFYSKTNNLKESKNNKKIFFER